MRIAISRDRRLILLVAFIAFCVPFLLTTAALAVTGQGSDINGDGVVNLADIGLFITLYVGGIYDPRADIDCDGVLSLADVGAFVQGL